MTGSYNWTKNSQNNLEHVVLLRGDQALAARFMREHLTLRRSATTLRRGATTRRYLTKLNKKYLSFLHFLTRSRAIRRPELDVLGFNRNAVCVQ